MEVSHLNIGARLPRNSQDAKKPMETVWGIPLLGGHKYLVYHRGSEQSSGRIHPPDPLSNVFALYHFLENEEDKVSLFTVWLRMADVRLVWHTIDQISNRT